MFVTGGWDAFTHPEGKVKAAEKVTGPLAEHVSILPDDTETLVRINGGVQVVAGSLLAVGKFRRLSALALIGSIIPTTYAGHRFWDELDDEKRGQQQVHFLKNLGLLGGLILAAVDTDGAPSMSWRLRRQWQRTGEAVSTHSVSAEERMTKAAKKAKRAARRANVSGHRLQAQIEAIPVEEAVKKAARRASVSGQRALRQIEAVPVRKAAHHGAQTATRYASAGAGRAEAVLSQARRHFASH
jgi:putative oxidoreductase